MEKVTDEGPLCVADVSANISGIYDFSGRLFHDRASLIFE